jgi:3'(2'), 5'-bisphosphate nucleotidase
MSAFEREMRVAMELARAAGRAILEVYATDFGVVEKANDAGPVTLADQRASEIIVAGLRAAFPGDGVISEEVEGVRDQASHARCWFVDPLDGTKEFVARNGEFAVHVGLAVGGEARLGVVYVPCEDTLYVGVVGEGSEVHSSQGARPLRVGTEADPSALRLLASRSHATPLAEAIARKLGARPARPCGSVGLKCGRIAEDRADAYFLTSLGSHLWDACAPEAVLRGAGGRVTDLDGNPFRYDVAGTQNLRGLVACNAAAFDAVRAAVRAALAEAPLAG